MRLLNLFFGARRNKHLRKPWQTKCENCNHNVIMKHGRCFHRNYNSGLQPGQDGDSPDEFCYVEYTQKCKLCSCTKPGLKKKSQARVETSREREIESKSEKIISHIEMTPDLEKIVAYLKKQLLEDNSSYNIEQCKWNLVCFKYTKEDIENAFLIAEQQIKKEKENRYRDVYECEKCKQEFLSEKEAKKHEKNCKLKKKLK